jgi:hypothetical protein
LPPGARYDSADPFADKRQPWWLYGALVIILLGVIWALGVFDPLLSRNLASTRLFPKKPEATGTNAPALTQPTNMPAAK